MVTFVDISNIFPQGQHFALDSFKILEQTNHPNLLNLVANVHILEEINTLVFRTECPDHISSWKQFCKTELSAFQTLSLFRQLASAIAHLNSHGIIHRDVHPTRLHLHNGILKFNMIGLPYNYKKLLKRPNFSGHVNYSAPEFILESQDFKENSDTWSLGCCLYYLVTKQDPFEGRSVGETKKNILQLRLDRFNALGQHDKIF